ncbi:MAG: hypothetical protein PWP11_838 [Thauera sp.]|nr:hypothetical protein [Thauera sp.]MDI3489561.1 hypothetical protein [Thauera sp.]
MDLAPFAAIEKNLADVTSAMLSNVVVVPEVGRPFGAEFDLADVDPIAPPGIIGDAQIVYRAGCADLQPGDTVWINEKPYRVASDPSRDGGMLTAQLREAS